eukprot:7090949-Pyramimonas_sp.AAC.1
MGGKPRQRSSQPPPARFLMHVSHARRQAVAGRGDLIPIGKGYQCACAAEHRARVTGHHHCVAVAIPHSGNGSADSRHTDRRCSSQVADSRNFDRAEAEREGRGS